jgi:hypothetical protein
MSPLTTTFSDRVVLISFPTPGTTMTAPGAIILYHRNPEANSHPFVVHWHNDQDDCLYFGGYHKKLSEALADFANRVKEYE